MKIASQKHRLSSKRAALIAPMILILFLIVPLTTLKVNQSSAGMYGQPKIGTGISGADRPIRSDEWLVRLPWLLSQKERNFESVLVTAGSHNPVITYDLPSKDFSLALKPHLLPYFVFDVDRAISAEWWILVIGSALATYLLLIALKVRRSIGLPLAVIMALSPGLHWWNVNSSFSVILYGALAATAIIAGFKAASKRAQIAFALLSGWLFSCAVVVLYPPFQIPTLILIALLLLVEAKAAFRDNRNRTINVLASSIIFFSALTFIFLVLNRAGLSAIAETTYPGSRRSVSGGVNLPSLLGTPFDLAASQPIMGTVNGLNQSENSSTFLLALPVITLLLFGSKGAGVPSLNRSHIRLTAGWFGVLCAWMLIHLPGFLGSMTLLNRVQPDRLKPGIAFASVILTALFLEYRYDNFSRGQRFAAVSCFAFITFVAGTYYTVNNVRLSDSKILLYLLMWFVPTVIAFCFSRKIGLWAIVAVSLVATLNINPLHRSVLPLYSNPIKEEMVRLDTGLSQDWLTLSGSAQVRGLMVASGAKVLSAVSPYPDPEFWRQFDPQSEFEDQWNRYGHVYFKSGAGPTKITSSQSDVINVEIDVCSALKPETFLIESSIATLPCLEEVGQATYLGTVWRFYKKI